MDQLQLNCCVSCAIGAAMEVMSRGGPALSPLFHYYVARYEDGGANSEGFLYLDNALGTLSQNGICRAELHRVPFTEAGSMTKPSDPAYVDGESRALCRRGFRFRYEGADGLSNTTWIRDRLRQDRPVLLGFRMPLDYPGGFLNARSEWLDPNASALSENGHCVLVTGYSDLRGAIHIQDSRGTRRFDRGTWWMGYRIVDSPIVTEIYALIP